MGISGMYEVSAAILCCFLSPTGLCQCWCCCLGSLFWLGVKEKYRLLSTDKHWPDPGPGPASCCQRCCKFHPETVFDCEMQLPKLILLWVQKPLWNNPLLQRPERNKKTQRGASALSKSYKARESVAWATLTFKSLGNPPAHAPPFCFPDAGS